jgi:trafficking protein particle complex subunit 8
VEEANQRPLDAAVIRTPWWEDLRRCVEGEWTPSRWEGWNHPVAGELIGFPQVSWAVTDDLW